EETKSRVADCLKEQKKRQGRLDTIGYDPTQWLALAAAAIEAAGGLEHLAGCVRSVWEGLGQWIRPDPTLETARALLADVEAKLARVSDPSSRLARSLRAERDVAAAQVEAIVEALTDRREAQARSLVERAARADENAVKELLGLAGSVPAAFPE